MEDISKGSTTHMGWSAFHCGEREVTRGLYTVEPLITSRPVTAPNKCCQGESMTLWRVFCSETVPSTPGGETGVLQTGRLQASTEN